MFITGALTTAHNRSSLSLRKKHVCTDYFLPLCFRDSIKAVLGSLLVTYVVCTVLLGFLFARGIIFANDTAGPKVDVGLYEYILRLLLIWKIHINARSAASFSQISSVFLYDTIGLKSLQKIIDILKSFGGNIQSSAIIMRSNIVKYYRNCGRISIRCWIHKIYPIRRPNGRVMRFLLRICF